MNQWHKIRISRRGNTADFSVDTTTARNRRSITPSSILNVDGPVYLGGLNTRKERYIHSIRKKPSTEGRIRSDRTIHNHKSKSCSLKQQNNLNKKQFSSAVGLIRISEHQLVTQGA